MKLEDIKGRCRVEDGHWIWTGALSGGLPNIWAPDFTSKDGKKVTQRGARAVWHVKHRRAIPPGHRVFVGCTEPLCVSPAHVKCQPMKEWGEEKAAAGDWKGNMKRILANRRIGQKRSSLDQQKYFEVLTSPKSGLELASELGACRTTISRIRAGHATAFTPLAGPFACVAGQPAEPG